MCLTFINGHLLEGIYLEHHSVGGMTNCTGYIWLIEVAEFEFFTDEASRSYSLNQNKYWKTIMYLDHALGFVIFLVQLVKKMK